MNILETLRTALEGLSTNKMRAVLTALGIIIGVAAVIILLAVGNGVQAAVTDEVQAIGSNLLIISAKQVEGATSTAKLTNADAEALADPFSAPAISAVAPEVRGKLRVTRDAEATSLTVTGTTPNYQKVRSLELAMGGFLNQNDLDERTRVAVLGWNAYEDLFPNGDYPIDAYVIIDDIQFQVIGVLQEKGGMGQLGSEDDTIYVPMTTAQARLFTDRTLSGDSTLAVIYATVVNESQVDAASQQANALLRELHEIGLDDAEDFQVISQQDILATVDQITGILTAFLGIIAGISLLVGGIGIMNIMLVSVTERTREVGIRKAVGAVPGDIVMQFLLEAIMLSVAGGLVGILIGAAGTSLLGSIVPDLAPRVTSDVVALSVGVASGVGLIFGVYPALRASKLRPIEALRYE